jgi:glutamate-1-semialdehyde 2,1-aminomutase
MAEQPGPESVSSRYETSIDLQERAVEEIPEASSSNVRGKSSYAPYPMIYMKEGDGALLRDVDGNEYIDYLCGVSSIITGHTPERQREAVKDQLDRGSYFATTYELEYETAKLVNEMVPSSDRVKFISTGTEAAMSAMRLARAYTGKEKILKFEGMYHGHTDYALQNVHPKTADLGTRHSAETIPAATGIPDGTRESVVTLPWNDVELLEQKLQREGDEIAAVITEAFLSNSGLLFPQDGYIKELRRLTEEHDVLLILDEVITGFRVALDGAEGHFDIEPDLSIWGKAMANGYPCGAVTGKAEIMDFIGGDSDSGDFMGTFSGNPVVVAAAKANLEMLQEIGESGYREFHDRGQRLVDGLVEVARDEGHDVWAADFVGFTHLYFHDGQTDPNSWTDWRDVERHEHFERWCQFAKAMIDEGIYMVPRNHGRLNMTHSHTDEHIDEAIEAAKEAVKHVDQ